MGMKSTNNQIKHSTSTDGKSVVSEWRWFDATIRFNNGIICEYASTTNGTIEDATEQAANVFIGQVGEVLHIAFR